MPPPSKRVDVEDEDEEDEDDDHVKRRQWLPPDETWKEWWTRQRVHCAGFLYGAVGLAVSLLLLAWLVFHLARKHLR